MKKSGNKGRVPAKPAKPLKPRVSGDLLADIAALRLRVSEEPASSGNWQQLAFTLARNGDHQEAVAAFEQARALGASMRIQGGMHAISLSALQRHAEAVALLAPVRARNAKDFELANLLGVLYKRLGQYSSALRLLDTARKLNPRSSSVWQNIGNVHEMRADFVAAAQAFGQGVLLNPADAGQWQLQGWALYKQGKYAAALASFAKGLTLLPDNWRITEAYVQTLLRLQRFNDAIGVTEKFLTKNPTDTEAVVMLARIHSRTGNSERAHGLLDTLLANEPGHLAANIMLGRLHGDGNLRAANAAFRRAIAANPDSWIAAEALVESLSRSRYDSEAAHMEEAYAAACVLQRAHPAQSVRTARSLRTVFQRMMDLERMAATGAMADLLPHWQAEGRHSLVHYELGQIQNNEDRLRLLQWHREWGRRVEARITPVTTMAMPALSLKRKLRIGFMSSDLRDHPVGHFARPLLQGYDRDRVEVFCYSFYEGPRSKMQALIESQVTAFRWWPKRPDHEVAEGIAADSLDMLFELGGSTAMNKLEVMAYRPARIGASWLGYPHSAGLKSIDYILVDPYLRPSDPRLLLEQPFELPETWVTVGEHGFGPESIAHDLPEDRRGYLSFGTANNPYKITGACVDAWAAVLRSVPGAHFLFLRPEAATASFVTNARAAFAVRDVDPARIDFIGVRGTHLQHYNAIDIALDSMPHVGGTTTCESLWMGVPTVSLVGEAFFERISYSNLVNAGLPELAAFTVADYVERAVMLAQDRAKRLQLRHGLRDMIRARPLGQSARFVDHFYRKAMEVASL